MTYPYRHFTRCSSVSSPHNTVPYNTILQYYNDHCIYIYIFMSQWFEVRKVLHRFFPASTVNNLKSLTEKRLSPLMTYSQI